MRQAKNTKIQNLIIYEDKDFIAVNKPAGLLVHRREGISKSEFLTSKEETLVDWLIKQYPEIKQVGDNSSRRPGIVHRLDKDTSGVLIIARNQKFFEYLKSLFQKHEVKKIYVALVFGELKPRSGVIEKPISLKPGTIRRTVHRGKLQKEAVTEYKVLKYFQYSYITSTIVSKVFYFSLVELIPRTGRTHQLRVHLASIGHPLVGDQLYSRRENPWGLKRQFLHAQSLEFSLPDSSQIKIEADLPHDLQRIIDSLTKEN